MEEKGYLEKVSGGGRSAVLQLTLDEFDPTDGKLQLTLGDLAPPTVSYAVVGLAHQNMINVEFSILSLSASAVIIMVSDRRRLDWKDRERHHGERAAQAVLGAAAHRLRRRVLPKVRRQRKAV